MTVTQRRAVIICGGKIFMGLIFVVEKFQHNENFCVYSVLSLVI